MPQSHNKEQQIVTRQNNIYSSKQRTEYKKFNLIKNTRNLIREEIVHSMFPMKEMNTLDEDIESEQFSINEYITSHLQQAFLPWRLSSLHILPDWVILTGLIIIGLDLAKIFFDPCMAICHLVRDSSLSITEKLSSAIMPATTITRLSRREQREIESRRLEEETIEVRIINLEKRVSMFQALLVKEKEKNNGSIKYLEN